MLTRLSLRVELFLVINVSRSILDFIYYPCNNTKITLFFQIKGYGHAVLRDTDPRFRHQVDFAKFYLKEDPTIKLLH